MITFTSHGVTFNYHSDLSGNVLVHVGSVETAIVPGIALLEFIAEYVRSEKTTELEEASPRAVLGLPE